MAEKEPIYVGISLNCDDQDVANIVSASILSGLKRDGFTSVGVVVEEAIVTGKEEGTHRGMHKPEELLAKLKTDQPELLNCAIDMHVPDVRRAEGVIETSFEFDDDGNAHYYIGEHSPVEDE